MAFDAELAHAFVKSGDRNVAPWFAGRQTEIESVADALVESRTSRATVFRIIQGAPGSGKTSLLRHLQDNAPPKRLFVELTHDDLKTVQALSDSVNFALARQQPASRQLFHAALKAGGTRFKLDPLREHLSASLRDREVAAVDVVLCVDEAHALTGTNDALRTMHTTGIGVPAALLLAGLSHTSSVIQEIPGLSRLADNSVCNLGALDTEECRESTRAMLAGFGVDEESEILGAMVAEVAAMSCGWPQHLHGAQKALAVELLEHHGRLGAVELTKVREQSDRSRAAYYRQRISSPLLEDAPFTARVVAEVQRRPPRSRPRLIELCRHLLDGDSAPEAIREIATPRNLANALIEKGVLTMTDDDGYEVAIPSMADWLTAEMRQDA